MKKELLIYQTPNGKEPFKDWRKKLKDNAVKARIDKRLQDVSIGYYGDYKKLSGDLLELRLHFGKGYRIYFAELGPVILLILSGGSKNTPGEQSKDIAKARLYLKEFLER